MTNEECAKALDDIQRRAYRHQNTGGPILSAPDFSTADPAKLHALGICLPTPKPARKPETGTGDTPEAVR